MAADSELDEGGAGGDARNGICYADVVVGLGMGVFGENEGAGAEGENADALSFGGGEEWERGFGDDGPLAVREDDDGGMGGVFIGEVEEETEEEDGVFGDFCLNAEFLQAGVPEVAEAKEELFVVGKG